MRKANLAERFCVLLTMNTNLLDTKFSAIGARVKVADRPARRRRSTGLVSLDIQTDRKGAVGTDAVDQRREMDARPGPLPDLAQRRFVHRDDRDRSGVRRARQHGLIQIELGIASPLEGRIFVEGDRQAHGGEEQQRKPASAAGAYRPGDELRHQTSSSSPS